MAFWCVVGIMMGDGEVVFINQMKTTIQEKSRKSGVHQADENHNPRGKQKKRRSSQGRTPQSKKESRKLVLQGNESQDIEWKNVHDKQYTFSQKTKAFI